MLKKIIFLIVFCFISSFALMSQDPQFSQFYAAPSYLNPALIGNTYGGRIILNYRNQWPAIDNGYVTYAFSYDYNFSKINSGFGLSVISDRAGAGSLQFTQFNLLYSYNLPITRFVGFRAGLYFAYANMSIEYANLIFADQYIRGSKELPTLEPVKLNNIKYLDAGSGIIFYIRKKLWAGTAFSHINRANQSLTGKIGRLPVKTTIHGGYNYFIKKDYIITFAANYKFQGKWDQLDLGAYYRKNYILVGLWYRGIPLLKAYKKGYQNNDAIIVMLGIFANEHFRFAYSYDITISRLFGNTPGSHELSIIMEYFKKHKKKKRFKTIYCPKF